METHNKPTIGRNAVGNAEERFAVPRRGERKPPSLTPVENSAFNELARQLSARLETENGDQRSPARSTSRGIVHRARRGSATPRTRGSEPPEWLAPSRAAGARRSRARQGAARSAAGRHSDLPARPAALRQPRLPRRRWAIRACTRWKMPAASTRSMSNPASPTPPRRRTPARR